MNDNIHDYGEDQEPTIPLSSALFAALPSWSSPSYKQLPFCSANPRRIVANDETRKLAITIVAAIFAAGELTDWDGKRSPRLVAGMANAIEKAKLLVAMVESRTA